MVHHILFALRTRAKLTQQDLAARTHIGQSTISMYEVGTRVPSPALARRLEDALGDTQHSLTAALTATPRKRGVSCT